MKYLFGFIIIISTITAAVEIPPRAELEIPAYITPGEEFSVVIKVIPGSKTKGDVGISAVTFSLPKGINGPEKTVYYPHQTAPLTVEGFTAETNGIYTIEGELISDKGDIAIPPQPAFCLSNPPAGSGTYFAAGIFEALGKTVFDEHSTLGISRRFGPEGKLYNQTVIWVPVVGINPGEHTITVEMRAEGDPGADNFVTEVLITEPGAKDDHPEILASRIVTGSLFYRDDTFYPVMVDVFTPELTTSIQVRLVYYGYAILYVDRIIVR